MKSKNYIILLMDNLSDICSVDGWSLRVVGNNGIKGGQLLLL